MVPACGGLSVARGSPDASGCHGLLLMQAVLQSVRDEGAHLAREVELHDRALSSFLAHKFECSTCHACLPTAHLLDIHVAEVHDSFFAAQAARRLPVYLCLVEVRSGAGGEGGGGV